MKEIFDGKELWYDLSDASINQPNFNTFSYEKNTFTYLEPVTQQLQTITHMITFKD